jgi:hypothetical protein
MLFEEPKCEEEETDVDEEKLEGGDAEGAEWWGVAFDVLEVLPVDVLWFFRSEDLEAVTWSLRENSQVLSLKHRLIQTPAK